jgi:SAM-dependent methyltransferase
MHVDQRRGAADWTSGYVSDVVYTLGFQRHLAPSLLDYAALACGIDTRPPARRRRYCELGCGRGFGTTLLAAANPDIDFVGIDFNPAHIAEAQGLAERARLENVRFLELGFGDAAKSGDPALGAFDVVALHGVYTWVMPAVRAEIHEFLRARLVPGGIAYVSYNTLPGWTRVIPTQKLLFEAGRRAQGDSLARVGQAMQLLNLLVERAEPMMARHGAISPKYVAHLAGRDRHYLAHEFLNAAWQPMFVADVVAALGEPKLGYVGSADVAENRLELCLPKDLRETVRAAPDVGMRELIKDIVLGQQFRRDIYAKGGRALTPPQQRQRLSETSFAPLPHIRRFPDVLRVPSGEVKPAKPLMQAMWRCLGGKAASGAELLRAANEAGEQREERVWTLLEILVHNGMIHPLRADGGAAAEPARRLNRELMALASAGDTHRYLAAPALGSAIPASYPDRIIAPLLTADPDLDDAAVADRAFDEVARSGQRIYRDGEPIEKTPEVVRSFAAYVADFRAHILPRWRLLGAID